MTTVVVIRSGLSLRRTPATAVPLSSSRHARGDLILASIPVALLVGTVRHIPKVKQRSNASSWDQACAGQSLVRLAVILALYVHRGRCLRVQPVRQHICPSATRQLNMQQVQLVPTTVQQLTHTSQVLLAVHQQRLPWDSLICHKMMNRSMPTLAPKAALSGEAKGLT